MGRHRSSHLPHDRSSEHPDGGDTRPLRASRKDGRSRAMRNALAACIALTAVTGLGSIALPGSKGGSPALELTANESPAATAGSATVQGVIPAAAATPGGACTKFIATTGSDAAAGTMTAPWRNVLQSLNKATPGAVLCVMPGTYTQ